jgi:hypothetical protein
MKSLPIILAVDFDDTIAEVSFPNIKGFRKGAKKYINKLYKEGYFITIWTCRTDKDECRDQTDAANFLKYHGVKFHLINENHYALNNRFKNDCRKVAADLYIDDKGLWLFGIPSWFWLYWIIKFKSFRLKKKILGFCKPEHFTN